MNELTTIQSVQVELPDNRFERYDYIQKLVERLKKLQSDCEKYLEEEQEELVKAEDDYYELAPVFDTRKSTIILGDKLREENEELWENCLSISGSNALKLLGENKLWLMCVKNAGRERTILSSDLTIKQMKKAMTDEEFKRYTVETRKQKGYAVVRK